MTIGCFPHVRTRHLDADDAARCERGVVLLAVVQGHVVIDCPSCGIVPAILFFIPLIWEGVESCSDRRQVVFGTYALVMLGPTALFGSCCEYGGVSWRWWRVARLHTPGAVVVVRPHDSSGCQRIRGLSC